MTRRANVIGDPIAHSKSPLIHGFWLGRLGLDATYAAAHVAPADLAGWFAAARRDPDWVGCNVTIPHKVPVLDLVDDPGAIRSSIGAMNTVLRQPDGRLTGTNTDAAGFYAPIAGRNFDGANVAVVGGGGAARAVLFALKRAGAGPITLVVRSPMKGAGLLAHFGLKGRVIDLGAPLPAVDLLVNASPLGMTGQPPSTLDLTPLPDTALVYDLVYTPVDTPLLRSAHDRGLETIGGLDMLVGQAALAFELLFGTPPPRDRDDDLYTLLAS